MKRLAVFFLALMVGCASYTPVSLPRRDVTDLSQHQKINDVWVGVKPLDSAEIQRYFDSDLIAKGVQPIYVTIENASDRSYSFSKENIGIAKLDSTEAAKKGKRNTLARAGVPGAISLVVLWPLAIWAVGDGISSAKANKKMRYDYESKEIADGLIRPDHSKYGVIYSPVLKSGEDVFIDLIDNETKEKISFKFTKE